MRRLGSTTVAIITCLIGATLLLGPGCGGGGGGGTPSTVSELAGGWLGPTGTASAGSNLAGTGGAGMMSDLSGAFAGTGAFSGKSGNIRRVAPRTYSFTRSDAVTGHMLLSDSGQHLAYLDSDGNFGIWHREFPTPPAHVFTTNDAFLSMWDGRIASFDATFDLVGGETMTMDVDGTGMITLVGLSTNAMTNAQPLSLVDGVHGEFTGDFVDLPDTGTYTILMSEWLDAQAIFACGTGGTFPEDCSFGIFERLP